MKALEVLNPNGIFLYGGQTISEAADLLLARKIPAAPVLNNQGRCIGVVGKDLLLTALLEGRTAETDICQIMQGSFQRMPAEEEFTLENNELSEFILVEKEGLPLGLIDFLYLSETIVPDKSQKMFEFYAFVDAVYTPVMAIDNAGRITIINKWMTRLLDLKQEDVLNVLAAEIIGENIILKLLQGQGINADERVNLKGRNFIPFCNDVIVNNETIGRVLLLRDISEVEELINESEYTRGLNRQLQAVIEFSYDGLYVTDGQANTLSLNKGFERIMGVNAEECVGKNMAQLVEEGVFSRSGTLTAIEKGGSVTLSLTSSTGKEALVTSNPIYDDDGQVILYVTNVRDITELNELERKLERVEGLREREMEAVIESMFDGLYVTDGMANTLRINQGFERIMGIKAEQCVGKNMKDLVAEGVFSRSGTLVALETGTRATISLTSSTGKEALVTSNPIYDEEGNIIMVVTNVRDITELNNLQRRLERVEELQELYKTELEQMKRESSHGMIMVAAKMKELVSMVIRIAKVDSTVLIQGESGVGKELIAEIIHANSKCKEGPFVRVNCGAIPDNLLESELFGYESGAFTGASKGGKLGLFELAKGGTIFLDEIGELPLNLQVKLLRVLQDHAILRVGGTEPVPIDCRILAGTNRDLNTMIEQKEFRLDLFYRLNVIPITVPPLRERREDIPVLINHFLQACNQKYNMKKQLDTGVYNTLAEYSWPGNVRELENLVERLVVTCINNIITVNDLPLNILNDINQPQSESRLIPLKEALENTERELLKRAFANYSSSYKIAEVLKINQSTVVRKAKKYGIKH